jgi:ABC-type polar amino acid transport system ATPase subunit
MTMIFVTHEMGVALEIATRICFTSDGVAYEEGPPSRPFTSREGEKTRFFLISA